MAIQMIICCLHFISVELDKCCKFGIVRLTVRICSAMPFGAEWNRTIDHSLTNLEHSVHCTNITLAFTRTVAQHQWRTEGGLEGSNPPPPKFRRPSKIVPNSTSLWKLLKIAEFRTPTPQDIRKKGSKILKIPPVRNCFILAMINKLVVIINSHKVPKIKKIYYMKWNFLYQIIAACRIPD